MGKYDVSPQKGSFLCEPELAFKNKFIPLSSSPFIPFPFMKRFYKVSLADQTIFVFFSSLFSLDIYLTMFT